MTLVVSVNVSGEISLVSGVFVQPSPEMLAAARKEHIDKETAVDIVRSQYPPELPRHTSQLVELNDGRFGEAEKMLTVEPPYVVWSVSVPGVIFYVDALTGDIIKRESTVYMNCFG